MPRHTTGSSRERTVAAWDKHPWGLIVGLDRELVESVAVRYLTLGGFEGSPNMNWGVPVQIGHASVVPSEQLDRSHPIPYVVSTRGGAGWDH